MASLKILVVEDDALLLPLISRVLREEGYASVEHTTVAGARRALSTELFDVVILDWMLPDGDGASFCGELRASGSGVPLLMLTARGEVADRVKGLRSGADDYLVKPFDVEELLLRVESLARRGRMGSAIRAGELSLDPLTREVRLGANRLDLTAKELQLLVALVSRRGEVISRARLLEQVWGLAFDPGSGVLDVHLSRLRDKLGEYAWMVETVRGAGFRFRSQR